MVLLYYGESIATPRSGDCGYDLKSGETVYLKPFEIYQFKTDLHVKIPKGSFGMIAERSSLGAKGIAVRGGIIDSSYRGEIIVCLQNLSQEHIRIGEGDKIAQMIIIPYEWLYAREVDTVEELGVTERGENGFGSTGK